MKKVKTIIYLLILPLAVLSGLVFANRETKKESEPFSTQLSSANSLSNLEEKKKWETSPDGIKYKAWEASTGGKKIHASHDKIKSNIKDFTDMEAVVTSVTFQRTKASPSGPKWLIISINGEEYMMQYTPKDFQQLSSLNVNDKIIVRSRSAGYSPNHPYLILSGDYIAHKDKILFKRDFSKKKGC